MTKVTGEGGLNQNLVKLQPIGRLNAVLVVTHKSNLLKAAAKAISRLDLANTTSGVQVYRVRYGDARQMALMLNDLFGSRNNNNNSGLRTTRSTSAVLIIATPA